MPTKNYTAIIALIGPIEKRNIASRISEYLPQIADKLKNKIELTSEDTYELYYEIALSLNEIFAGHKKLLPWQNVFEIAQLIKINLPA